MIFEHKVKLSAEQVAEGFCELDDDAQAQVFVHIARIMDLWPEWGARVMQVHYISKHLRDCACVTDEARELVLGLAEGIAGATP